MWTATELKSNAVDYQAEIWRVVEAQHHISTMRLAKDLEGQRRLEELADAVKPKLPREARTLHWLLASPFRYGHKSESRFRRANEKPGIFYGSEQERTALCEVAYWRARFFSRSMGFTLPKSTAAYTSFSVNLASAASIDLSLAPFDRDHAKWVDRSSYTHCQALAKVARQAEIQCIRTLSARDPDQMHNVVVLDPRVFVDRAPQLQRTWYLRCEAGRVTAQAGMMSPDAYTFEFGE